jgi:hypothetical protein
MRLPRAFSPALMRCFRGERGCLQNITMRLKSRRETAERLLCGGSHFGNGKNRVPTTKNRLTGRRVLIH